MRDLSKEIFPDWSENKPTILNGIIVGCDEKQEWMLPWWWLNFSSNNRLPVAFVDFGLSKKAKAWCEAHGTLISLQSPSHFVAERDDVDPSLVAIWESLIHRNSLWSIRKSWFKKPLALMQTPFQNTLWIDVDCQIKGALDAIFTISADMALSKERLVIQELLQAKGLTLPGEITYNSGMIFYKYNSKGVLKWAQRTLTENNQFWGDQDLLSRIIYEDRECFEELPEIYNWNSKSGSNPNAVVCHWVGISGKNQIQKQINELSFVPILSYQLKIS